MGRAEGGELKEGRDGETRENPRMEKELKENFTQGVPDRKKPKGNGEDKGWE